MRTRACLIALAIVVAGTLFAAAPARPASANGGNVHCVKWGETLYGIGYMYGVSAHAIAHHNGLWNPNYIRAGQCLHIPSHGYGHGGYDYGKHRGHGGYDGGKHMGHGGYDGGKHMGHGGYDDGKDMGHGGYGYGKMHQGKYCVRYGDTLSGIAASYGVSTWAIAKANGLWNPDYVAAGSCLVIPSW